MASIDPTVTANQRCFRTPNGDARRGDARSTTLALRPGLETRVSQKTARIFSNFERPDTAINQTHSVAAQGFLEEVPVSTYESGTAQAAQQGNDFVVLHSLATNIAANLAEMHTPAQQLCPLTL